MDHLSKYTHIIHLSSTESVIFNSLFMEGILVRHPNCEPECVLSAITSTNDNNLNILRSAHVINNPIWDDKIKELCVKHIHPPKINTCVLVLTERCNLCCRYCFIEKNLSCKEGSSSMTPEIASQAIEYFSKQITNIDETSIILYGGEPLMNPQALYSAIKTIEYLQNEGQFPLETHISINTNGTLINEEIAEYLSNHNITVSISIDGDCHQNKDRLYHDGRESFNDVIEAIRICQRHSVKYGISITATPKLLKDYKSSIDFVKCLSPSKVGINPLLAAGELYSEYGEDLLNMMVYAKTILNEHGIEEDRLTDRLTYLESRCIKYHDCSAANGEQIVITPDGSVGICHEFVGSRDFFISNIWSEEPLSENENLKKWILRTPILMDECEDCIALGVCGGGCPANAYNIYGDIMNVDRNCCGTSKELVKWYFKDYVKSMKSITL